MRGRTFWGGLVLGAGAGMFLGHFVACRRRQTPVERTKMMIGKSAHKVLKTAQGTLGRVADRLSD